MGKDQALQFQLLLKGGLAQGGLAQGPIRAHKGQYGPIRARMGPYEPIWARMGPYGPVLARPGPTHATKPFQKLTLFLNSPKYKNPR